MPAPIIPRHEVVRRLFEVFRTYGYDGATLARMSEATGLQRASLYHYFPDGKDAMLREILSVAQTWIDGSIAQPLADPSMPPAARIKHVIANVVAGYDEGAASCLVNLTGIGDAAAVAGTQLRELAHRYVDAFERFFAGVGMQKTKARDLATDTVMQIEGALVLARALGDPSIFVQRMELLQQRLLDAEKAARA